MMGSALEKLSLGRERIPFKNLVAALGDKCENTQVHQTYTGKGRGAREAL